MEHRSGRATLVKCPKCYSLVEGIAGTRARCKECGYEANIPAVASAPEPKGLESVELNRVTPTALVGPLGLMAGLAGLATFYLSPYVFPFLLSGAGAGLGLVGLRTGRDRLAIGALVTGAVGLVLEILTLALAA